MKKVNIFCSPFLTLIGIFATHLLVAQVTNVNRGMGAKFMDQSSYNNVGNVDEPNLQPVKNANVTKVQITNGKLLDTPPVADQGQEGSCTAFAAGYCIASYYQYKYNNKPYTQDGALRSPEFLYNSTRLSGSCRNAGAYVNQVLEFIKNKGICSWAEMPYSDNNDCDARPSNEILNKPTTTVAQFAYWKTVPNDVDEVKKLINKGFPILMALRVNDKFIRLTCNPPYTLTSYKAQPTDGGHTVVIVGYDDDNSRFIVQNSWGTGFHDKGFFYIAYNIFNSMQQQLFVAAPYKPSETVIRHDSDFYSQIKLKVNGKEHTLNKKGETLTISEFQVNEVEIWVCPAGDNCAWIGGFKAKHYKKYKITDTGNKGLKLADE